jgi:hypothetical protein
VIEYSYTLLKYRHDQAAGEVLNVGVALLSSEGQVGVCWSSRYARLSEAFAGFDGELYKDVLEKIERALERISKPMREGLFQLEEREKYPHIGSVVRLAWPDQGLAYFVGPVMFGVTDNIEQELTILYDRFVLSQFDRQEAQARLDDNAIWSNVRRVLTPRGITRVLQSKALGPAEVEFEHAYLNHKWHVLEIVSLDYAHSSDVKQRALLTAGKASAVRDLEEFGSMTIIVAKPRRLQSEKPFRDAMRILENMPVKSRIVEEPDVDRFAESLEREMKDLGLLPRNGALAT